MYDRKPFILFNSKLNKDSYQLQYQLLSDQCIILSEGCEKGAHIIAMNLCHCFIVITGLRKITNWIVQIKFCQNVFFIWILFASFSVVYLWNYQM